MSNSLSTVQKDIDLTRKLGRKIQTKETSVTHELQQVIIAACEKLHESGESPTSFVEKVNEVTGINLTHALKEILENDAEKIAKNFARANQFEITYSGFKESDTQAIIDTATIEKDDAIADLTRIFGRNNRQLQRVTNGQTIKHFNPKITELKDIFSVAAIYPDSVYASCLSSMGAINRLRFGIESATHVTMKNARYLIDHLSVEAKNAILSTQAKSVIEITPSVVTDACNILQSTAFKNEGLIEKHRQRISDYRYALRIYEEVTRDIEPISDDEIIAELLCKINKVSLSLDINLFEKSFCHRKNAISTDTQLTKRITKLFAFRCLLQNTFAVITKAIVSMDEVYEKRRQILNKVCRSSYALGTKPNVDDIFDLSIYSSAIDVNNNLRAMVSSINLDIDTYDEKDSLNEFVEMFNSVIINSGLAEPTSLFSVLRDPQRNFDSSTFYEIFNERIGEILLESEKQLLIATKLERADKEESDKDEKDEHWSEKLSSNLNDGISVMPNKELVASDD